MRIFPIFRTNFLAVKIAGELFTESLEQMAIRFFKIFPKPHEQCANQFIIVNQRQGNPRRTHFIGVFLDDNFILLKSLIAEINAVAPIVLPYPNL